jgi:hypothetical protein
MIKGYYTMKKITDFGFSNVYRGSVRSGPDLDFLLFRKSAPELIDDDDFKQNKY